MDAEDNINGCSTNFAEEEFSAQFKRESPRRQATPQESSGGSGICAKLLFILLISVFGLLTGLIYLQLHSESK